MIILCAWAGCIGGWCAVQASANCLCECAVALNVVTKVVNRYIWAGVLEQKRFNISKL